MINRPKDWDNVKESADFTKLPLGAYVCRIRQAAVQTMKNGTEQLAVLFDISEGEWQNFFDDDFKNQQMYSSYDPKWKGVLRVWIPKDDGSVEDGWTMSNFKGFTNAVENSNPGYVWKWDEKSLRGQMIGIIFRNEEWENNGKSGFSVRPYKAVSVDKVRSGDFKIPDDKLLKRETSHTPAYADTAPTANIDDLRGFSNVQFADEPDDGDLPF